MSMQSNHKKRICIVARSLSEGGSDRVAAMQSVYLSELGYEVFLVTILDDIVYPYKGTLLNLGVLKKTDNSVLGRLKRFFVFRNFIKSNEINIVIDHRVRIKTWSEWIISRYIYGRKGVYLVHSSAIERFFPNNQFIAKRIYQNTKKIVAVTPKISEDIKEKYGYQNLAVIPNAVNFEAIDKLKTESIEELPKRYILWYGRLDNEVKNLHLLIDAYKFSKLFEKDVFIVILGKGKDEITIKNYVKSLHLEEFIIFKGFVNNPFKYIENSLFVTLTSRYEGFSMSLIESLACGSPVVSVMFNNYEDAPLVNGYNGLWVENYDAEALGIALNTMVNNKELYFSCKQNTRMSIEHLSIEKISKKWQLIIEAE
jgi:glycosyltransferase involved in cell wall biosynthesis